MATFRQQVLQALATIRPILGPAGLDLRVTQMFVVTRTWPGGRRGMGVKSDVLVEVLPRPTIRAATLKDVDSSAGKIQMDDVIVDHIQPLVTMPNGTTVGISMAQLAPSQTVDGVEIFYKLVSEDNQGFNGDFYKKWLSGARPFRHTMVLTRGASTPSNT